MFEKQKNAIRKDVEQELRIEQLEDIICPNGAHSWVTVEKVEYADKAGTVHTINKRLCKKCKKKHESVVPNIGVE